jgi:predicted AAA+ superfamily ATPase
MIDFLQNTYHRLIQALQFTQHRYLYSQFNIDDRLTGLIGPRGVGKTTLLLQYIKENLYPNTSVFYFSADNIYFNKIRLIDFINDCYYTDGIRIFFIDEIHKYPEWSISLKNIYDSFPDVKIIFSGSSSMDIIKGASDLSRRANMFYLHGLSFREYLNFSTNSQWPVIEWDDLLKHYLEFGVELTQINRILGYFQEYLKKGYYPFIFESESSYYGKINQVIEKTIYEDIANYYSLKTPNLYFFKSILNYLASIPPGSISTHSIGKHLELDDKTVFHYLTILKETGLVRFIPAFSKGKQLLKKPEKILLNNTTLHSVINVLLGENNQIGTQRELFFLQSTMNAGLSVFASQFSDFQINNYLFEIGGKNKTSQQIRNTKLQAFLVKDDILVGNANTIPLFYFGFCY